jgi:hypothetical protein
VTSRNDIHSETDARRRGTTSDPACSCEPDRSMVAVDVDLAQVGVPG